MSDRVTIVIFCLGDKWQDWQTRGFANRSASVALELSRRPDVNRLIVVNNPTSFANALVSAVRNGDKRDNARNIVWRGPFGYYLDEVEPGVTVIEQLRLFPKERSRSVTFAINNALFNSDLIGLLKSILPGDGKTPIVLWLNSPVFARFAGSLGEDLAVYDARDDWVYHPQLRPIHRELEHGYDIIRKRFDIVFAVSETLVNRFDGGCPEALWVPNGISTDLFDGNICSEPPALRGLPRPIVGYVGKMQQRFDTGLMAEVARSMPGVSFILVGPIFTPGHFEELKRLSNVHFTGRVHQAEIPAFISNFDACIMPHVDDELTAAMNPLKIYEYLAYGKPTVCTHIRGLDQFEGLIEFAGDARSFTQRIGAALDEEPDKRRQRMAFANEQRWSKRVEYMVKTVDRKLHEKACNLSNRFFSGNRSI